MSQVYPAGTTRIPTPPPQRGKRRKRTNPRAWIWPLAFVVGIALGIGAYQWVPRMDFYFDYWLALALG